MEDTIKKKKSMTLMIIIAAIAAVAVLVIVMIVVKTNSPEYKLKKQLEIADKYLAELNYEQAIIAYKNALEINPKNTEAYLGLAEAYLALDEIDNAKDILRRGIDETGDEGIIEELAQIYVEEAELYSDAQDYERARYLLQEGYEQTGSYIIELAIDKVDQEKAKKDDEQPEDGEADESEDVSNNSLSFSDLPVCFYTETWTMTSWWTRLDLKNDGSFNGEFWSYISMIQTYEGNSFSGKFGTPEKINEYSYRIPLLSVKREELGGEYTDEYGALHQIVEPAGIESDDDFILYLPGTPVSQTDPAFQWWLSEIGHIDRGSPMHQNPTVIPDNFYVLIQGSSMWPFVGYKE